MSKTVMILVGPPGCGKSTFAKSIMDQSECAGCVSADDFFVNPETGEYKFDPSKIGEAHAECMGKFIHNIYSMSEGPLIVDNTNIRTWEWRNYAMLAKHAGWEVEFHVWRPNTVQELLACCNRNRHGVPSLKIAEMAMALYTEEGDHWRLGQSIFHPLRFDN